MGIRGLSTYITNRSELYLKPFDLCNTYLIIDGCNIEYQLYSLHKKSNIAFGGDYDKYAQVVRKFFEDFQKCNVTPIVILDGGGESRKDNTVRKRLEEKMKVTEFFTPSTKTTLILLPALSTHVFISILKEMNIKHIRCLFDADNAIATAAKCLNCPVLSADSDFYIYGTSYIPFNTLDINVTRKWRYNVKLCKIYRTASLLNAFPGLDESILPLAAVLLGNDYIEENVFKNFYRCIKVPKVEGLNYSVQQCRIEATLHWLSKHKLDTALIRIMSNIPHDKKKEIFKLIKMILNEYTNMSTNILIPLGFSKESIVQIASQNIKNNSNIQANTNHLKIIEEFAKAFEITDIDESKSKTELEDFINSCPTWFIDEYQKVLLPYHFIDLLRGREHICQIQIEDYRQPSSVFIGEKIMNVIFTLLMHGFEKSNDCVEYVTRGENNQLSRYPLKYLYNIFPFNIPFFHDLRNTSLTARRKIFDITLGVEQQIDEFPCNWKLYIATVKYWIEHLTNVRSDSHIYALLFAMLHHIIDGKIGYYRSMDEFQIKYEKKLLMLKSTKKGKANNLSYSAPLSIMQALNDVEIDDCVLLAPFFINNTKMDQECYTNSEAYNINIVHLFALFQICIDESSSLNALLGFPYDVTCISNMYNGTLLYNLYNNFNKRSNIEHYINYVLRCSPSLLQLFNIILIKAKLMFKICAAAKQKTLVKE